MMSPQQVQSWLDAYCEAWQTYDPELIADLFSEDATYAYHPWDDPIHGREAIVSDWLADRDEPGSWEADYYPLLISDGGVAIQGQTRYTSGKVYENLWILEFNEDGKCTRFVEWFMMPPESTG